MATSVVMGGVTFNVDETLTWGLDEGGKAYIVQPTGTINVASITPGTSGDESGAMLNPQRTSTSSPTQGYDDRSSNYSAGSNDATNISMTAGDVLIKVISTGTFTERAGMFTEIACLHVVASAPSSGNFLGSSIGYAGKSTPVSYSVDIDTWYTNRTVYSSASVDFPAFSDLMDAVDQFHPLYAQIYAAFNGYEQFSPFRFGGGSSTNPNYGRYQGQMMGTALMAITTDQYTEAQIKELATRLVQHGIEWGDPMMYGEGGASGSPDGGHFQFHQGVIAFTLSLTGRTDEIEDIMTATPANWDSAFLITSGIASANFTSHSDVDKAATWRLRTLSTQPGGSVVRIPVSGNGASGDWYQTSIHVGMIATRPSDGETAVVATTSAINNSSSSLTSVDITLTGTSPFSSGDIIYFDVPSGWVDVGQYEWSLRGGYNVKTGEPQMFSPSANNQYRDLQAWMGQIIALRALGILDTTFSAVQGYAERAKVSNEPETTNDYNSLEESWQAPSGSVYDTSADYFAQHWTALLAQAQIGATSTTVTIATALTPNTTATSMVDGLVIGLLPNGTSADVEFKGTTDAADSVQIQIKRQSDDSIVQAWTTVATPPGSGSWSGTTSLPKADEWWYAEVRPLGNPSAVVTLSEKFAVGWKVMLLGQSQMVIMTGSNGNYTADTGNYDTASFFAWQDWNFNDTSPSAESLVLLNASNGSDGLRAFVDQVRVFDSAPVMLVREAVSGTSILDLTDDGFVTRAWSDLTDKTAKYGGDFTAVVVNWTTANASPLEGNEGVDIMQGINTWESEHSATPDHDLVDILQAGYAYVVSPGTRHSNTSTNTYRDEEVARAVELSYSVGPPVSDYQIAAGDSAHPPTDRQSNVRIGQRMAVGFTRAAGIDASSNPALDTAERSLDGTQIIVSFVLPNGGNLYSPAPTALTAWQVSENSGSTFSATGFSAAISGNTAVFTIDSGTWATAASLQIKKSANMGPTVTVVTVEEDALMAGELYETWSDDVLGLGMPIHGVISGGDWIMPSSATIETITQGDGVVETSGFYLTPSASSLLL